MKSKFQNPNIRIIVIISLIFGLVLPFLTIAQENSVSPPENIEEIQTLGEKAAQVTGKELPGNLENIWNEEVLPMWQKMYDWFLANIWSKVDNWFKDVFKPLLKEEAEKRKPIIEEEFQKEKGEVKAELPQVTKSLWERFKDLIK